MAFLLPFVMGASNLYTLYDMTYQGADLLVEFEEAQAREAQEKANIEWEIKEQEKNRRKAVDERNNAVLAQRAKDLADLRTYLSNKPPPQQKPTGTNRDALIQTAQRNVNTQNTIARQKLDITKFDLLKQQMADKANQLEQQKEAVNAMMSSKINALQQGNQILKTTGEKNLDALRQSYQKGMEQSQLNQRVITQPKKPVRIVKSVGTTLSRG